MVISPGHRPIATEVLFSRAPFITAPPAGPWEDAVCELGTFPEQVLPGFSPGAPCACCRACGLGGDEGGKPASDEDPFSVTPASLKLTITRLFVYIS